MHLLFILEEALVGLRFQVGHRLGHGQCKLVLGDSDVGGARLLPCFLQRVGQVVLVVWLQVLLDGPGGDLVVEALLHHHVALDLGGRRQVQFIKDALVGRICQPDREEAVVVDHLGVGVSPKAIPVRIL